MKKVCENCKRKIDARYYLRLSMIPRGAGKSVNVTIDGDLCRECGQKAVIRHAQEITDDINEAKLVA